jgi:hypothetical protein
MAEVSEAVVVNETLGDSARPEIAISSTDDIYVVWEHGSASREIYFASSEDGMSFSGELNVSNDTVDSRDSGIAVSSTDDIYVVWERGGLDNDILLAKSENGGVSFGTATTVNNGTGNSARPEIAVSSTDDIYVVWENTATGDILLAKSENGGVSFGTATTVSQNSGRDSVVATFGSDTVFVAWQDASSFEIHFSASEDSGANFGADLNVSDDLDASTEPTISVSNSGITYLAWTSLDDELGTSEVLLVSSNAGNISFAGATNASPFDSVDSVQPTLSPSTTDDSVLISWTDFSLSSGDIFLAEITEPPGASLTLEGSIVTEPRWGIDEVVLQGTAQDFETGDFVVIDWGDGSTSPELEISPDGSWSSSNIYAPDSVANNPQTIIARLFDSLGNEIASSAPVSVSVARHFTTLSLGDVKSVKEGQELSVTGTLFDASTANIIGIAGREITFEGSGAGIPIAVTDEEGIFSSNGPAPDVGPLKSIQPHFAGDDLYLPSQGNVEVFNVVDNSTAEFDLLSGEPSDVVISEFGASITFDNVLESGRVYVAECDAPESGRYVDLGICLAISPSALLAEDTGAHITVSFSGTAIPSPFTKSNVGLFYEGISGIVDITESRNITNDEVVGRTEDFGKFIVGVALHEPSPAGSVRTELFVKHNQTVSPNVAVISLDKEEYEMTDTATITIIDLDANIDVLSADDISVQVSSTTSAPEGIIVVVEESGPDTGIFAGTFDFTEDTSSGTSLQSRDGDELAITYEKAAPRFNATFDSMIEAGVVDMMSGDVLNPGPVVAFTPPINIQLVDARIEQGSSLTISMSYYDIDLKEAEPTSLRLLHQRTPAEDWVDITLPGGEGHLLDENRIVGIASFPGTFVIGCDVDQTQSCSGGPGGGGGGVPRPGTGILLDNAARVVNDEPESESSDRSGGGSGGGSRSASVTTIPIGSNVETSVQTERGVVTVLFESIGGGSGQLRVDSNELAAFDDFFAEITFLPQDDSEHGLIHSDGKSFVTVGEVFDIDASAVSFDGSVTVTIPFDEAAVQSFETSEANVKFMHYDEGLSRWEDMTLSVDEQANTVTGKLNSLSPVVAVIMIDGGTGEIQITSVRVANPSFSLVSGQATLTANLTSSLPSSQEYFILIQLVDAENIAQYINWQVGSLNPKGVASSSFSWSVMEEGEYTIQIVVLTDMQNPQFLAEPISFKFTA